MTNKTKFDDNSKKISVKIDSISKQNFNISSSKLSEVQARQVASQVNSSNKGIARVSENTLDVKTFFRD